MSALNTTSTIQFFKGQPRNILAQLKNSAFVKNVLVVMSGTALAQVLSFALSPIISRLYSPADFGVFGSFTAILGLVGAGITLEYSQALMLPKKKDEAFMPVQFFDGSSMHSDLPYRPRFHYKFHEGSKCLGIGAAGYRRFDFRSQSNIPSLVYTG
jgi:hypothetical protein